MTNLPNRTYLNEKLKAELLKCKKNSFGGAIIFIGLDNFSLINEFFGHETGDKVLIYLSNKLNKIFEDSSEGVCI